MYGAFRRYRTLGPRSVGSEMFMHGLRRHPRIGPGCLELRVRLARWFHQGMNFLLQFWMLCFGLVPAACRESIHAANPSATLVQPGVDGFPSPPEGRFGQTRLTRAILECHLRLKLSPPKAH